MGARLFRERLVEMTQAVLMVISLVGVVNATRTVATATPEPLYLAAGRTSQRSADRRYTDLARFDRKRREDAQRMSGRRPGAASEASADATLR
jgi:hypothetical protein